MPFPHHALENLRSWIDVDRRIVRETHDLLDILYNINEIVVSVSSAEEHALADRLHADLSRFWRRRRTRWSGGRCRVQARSGRR